MIRPLALFFLALLPTLPSFAAAPARPYHLELEANPAASFPYLGKFGAVDLHVYPGGVYADGPWLNGFSRNGAPSVTVVNPLGRMYVDMPVAEIAPTLRKLSGSEGSTERGAVPVMGPAMKGKVRELAATRYRLMYGPEAWIDIWTTTAVPVNPQLQALVHEFVRGVSPGSLALAKKIPGTPIYVELNFRRFKKVPILTLKKLSFDSEGEEDALTLGRLYMKAPMLDAIWK
jgi:hypothetical protein